MKRATFLAINKWANDKAYDLLGPKNDCYGGEEDALRNFRLSRFIGLTEEDGCLTRMADKLARAAKLIKNENAILYDESILDTLLDLKNYAGIMICILIEHGVIADPFKDNRRPSPRAVYSDKIHLTMTNISQLGARHKSRLIRLYDKMVGKISEIMESIKNALMP